MTHKERDLAYMISDVIGQVAQLELMTKYGIKPNTEFTEKVHDKYYKEATTPEKIEAQVAINTQRDIDVQIVAPKEPEKPKRTWRNLIKLFHENEPKQQDGYSHKYRR